MTAPPGWYPDASQPGSERWWDGGAWSEVTRPAPGAAPAPAAPEPASPHPAPGYGSNVYAPPEQYRQPEPYGQPPYGQPQGYAPYPGAQPYGAYPGYGATPPGKTTPDGVPVANPWRRLGARLLDGLIIWGVTAIIGLPLVRSILDDFRRYFDEVQAATVAGRPTPSSTSFLTNATGDLLKLTALTLLVAALYEIPLTKYLGSTVGKLALGIRVRPMNAEGLPSWGQAVLRFAGQQLPGLIPNLGSLYALLDSLWLLWDPRRQCLHDKIARTAVVDRRPRSQQL